MYEKNSSNYEEALTDKTRGKSRVVRPAKKILEAPTCGAWPTNLILCEGLHVTLILIVTWGHENCNHHCTGWSATEGHLGARPQPNGQEAQCESSTCSMTQHLLVLAFFSGAILLGI